MARDGSRGGRGSKNNKTARVLNLLTDPDSAQSNDPKADEPAAAKEDSAGKHIKLDKHAQEQIRNALEQELLGDTPAPAAALAFSSLSFAEPEPVPDLSVREEGISEGTASPAEETAQTPQPAPAQIQASPPADNGQEQQMPETAAYSLSEPGQEGEAIQPSAAVPAAPSPEESQFLPFQPPRIEDFQETPKAVQTPPPGPVQDIPEPARQQAVSEPTRQQAVSEPARQQAVFEPVPAAGQQTAPASAPQQAAQEIRPMPMSRQPLNHPEQSHDEYICFNVTQSLVEDKADKYIKMFGMCTCPRCRIDVIALAMSNLPAKYVVAKPKEMIPRLSMYEAKYSAAVITQVMKACKKVIDRPHHMR